MSSSPECIENAASVVGTIQNEVGRDMAWLDLHPAIEIRFVHRCHEIDRLHGSRHKGVVNRGWIISFQAFEYDSVHVRH